MEVTFYFQRVEFSLIRFMNLAPFFPRNSLANRAVLELPRRHHLALTKQRLTFRTFDRVDRYAETDQAGEILFILFRNAVEDLVRVDNFAEIGYD